MLLHELTPAESLLLRKGDETPLNDALRYTLIDLLIKQVLSMEDDRRDPLPNPIVAQRYIRAGKNFNDYAALPHEICFLIPFRKSKGLRMLFKNCVQVGFENATLQRALQKMIMSSPMLHNAFEKSFIQYLVGGFYYSSHGFSLRRNLDDEINQVERQLTHLLKTNREEALSKAKLLNGNILFLNGLDLTAFKEFEAIFLDEVTERKNSSDGGGCGGWSSFETYSCDFSESSPSDSDSSGCSGDSGCGSGCGGGCGGD
jgi:hypothetical protein